MKSIELVKQIYEKATERGKKAWMSEKQSSFMFSLLFQEGRLEERAKCHKIGYILPGGEWVESLTYDEAIKIGLENLKVVKVKPPVFYIKRNGFNLNQIFIENRSNK